MSRTERSSLFRECNRAAEGSDIRTIFEERLAALRQPEAGEGTAK